MSASTQRLHHADSESDVDSALSNTLRQHEFAGNVSLKLTVIPFHVDLTSSGVCNAIFFVYEHRRLSKIVVSSIAAVMAMAKEVPWCLWVDS